MTTMTLIFEKTAPGKWFVTIEHLGNLTLGPFPSKKQAKQFAEKLG